MYPLRNKARTDRHTKKLCFKYSNLLGSLNLKISKFYFLSQFKNKKINTILLVLSQQYFPNLCVNFSCFLKKSEILTKVCSVCVCVCVCVCMCGVSVNVGGVHATFQLRHAVVFSLGRVFIQFLSGNWEKSYNWKKIFNINP